MTGGHGSAHTGEASAKNGLARSLAGQTAGARLRVDEKPFSSALGDAAAELGGTDDGVDGGYSQD